jgi:hypothetical protein
LSHAKADPYKPHGFGFVPPADTLENRATGDRIALHAQDSPAIATARLVFSILSEALEAGGFSSGRIVERLREEGIEGLTVSHPHGVGLQAVANAITDGAAVEEMENRLIEAEERIRMVAESGWTGNVLAYSSEDVREALSCTEADRCGACRCQEFLSE